MAKFNWVEVEKKERGGAQVEVGTKKILVMAKTSVGVTEVFAKKFFKDKGLSWARVFVGPMNKDKNAFRIGIKPVKEDLGGNSLSVASLRNPKYKQKVHYLSGPTIYRQIEETHGITRGRIQGYHKMKWDKKEKMLIAKITVVEEDVFEKEHAEKEKKIKKALEEENEIEQEEDEFEDENDDDEDEFEEED